MGGNITSSSKVVHDQNGYFHMKEKSQMVPSKLSGLVIQLEISQKSAMSSKLFARLQMAYSFKLRSILTEKYELKTMMSTNGELYCIFQSFMFLLRVKNPTTTTSQGIQYPVQEALSRIGLEFANYSGLCGLVHRWLAANYLTKAIPELVMDLLIASIFTR
jgi:hypothetical protein